MFSVRTTMLLVVTGTISLSSMFVASSIANGAELVRTPQISTSDSHTTKPIADRVDSLERNVAELNQYKSYIDWAIWLGGPLVTILGFFGYSSIKKGVRRFVDSNLQGHLDRALHDSLPTLLKETQQRAEDYLLRLAKLLALRSYGAFDDALREFGWNGQVASLRKETPTVRQAVIDCLHSAAKGREQNRAAAWEALQELIQDDRSAESLRLYLRLSIAARHTQEGSTFYDANKDAIRKDKESSLRAATLLRKLGRLQEALELVRPFKTNGEMETAVHLAVLERDLGNFDEVHDVLLPQVKSLITRPAISNPEGWHRLINTFIANAIDRNHPDDGVPAAEFMMRSAPGPVEAFTVGRLVLALPVEHPKRSQLRQSFEEALDHFYDGEATIRCKVVAKELSGDLPGAKTILETAIKQHGQQAGERMHPDVYFQRCALAGLLISQDAADDAIDVLMPAAGFSYGGEAKYHLAVSYAIKKDGRDAARWLKQAIDEVPKWAVLARDNNKLRHVPEVCDVLAQVGKSKSTV